MAADRKSLVEGLKTTGPDPRLEKAFVFGEIAKTKPVSATPESREGKGPVGNVVGRVPLTTRVKSDFATALKRASLERQLNGVFPNTLQDILEEALEPWLRGNGYLK
ncbi:hypothetical protein [Zavarzinella formosa]|uniref:hypothetical protein n=1 Tax=Zavarzinella formosa TaxID=360055 RepID=UPI0002E599B2|nr:hypothetical protein [Zavarzinella formosa]